MRVEPVRRLHPDGHAVARHEPSAGSLEGLSWLNFLVSMMQTGFGAFLAVNLSAALWSRTDVGLALSVASVAGLVAQVPGGALVDATSRKRLIAAAAIIFVIGAALIIVFLPARMPVFSAMALQGVASAVLAPAIAAITLALVPHAALAERLGLNVRYAALGSALAAAAMGAIGAAVSSRLSMILAACFGLAALAALRCITGHDLANAAAVTDHIAIRQAASGIKPSPKKSIFSNRQLLIFAMCILLFQLGNAGVLPLAIGSIVRDEGRGGDLIVAGAVILSQVLAAMLSSPLGRLAAQWGRRPVLLLGLAALPMKALLFSLGGASAWVIGYQSLDAISAAAFGLLIPLMVADITRRRGHFNLAMGMIGLASGIGGAAGTFMAGAIADRFGVTPGFLALAATGLSAVALAWAMLAETQVERPATRAAIIARAR